LTARARGPYCGRVENAKENRSDQNAVIMISMVVVIIVDVIVVADMGADIGSRGGHIGMPSS
jgi:hypothetical protein